MEGGCLGGGLWLEDGFFFGVGKKVYWNRPLRFFGKFPWLLGSRSYRGAT